MSVAATRPRTSTRPGISIRPATRSSSPSSPARTGGGATSTRWNLISPEWPELPFAEWEDTCDTLHMWSQIVGKTRGALAPLENHWWNVTLYVTPRGLTTSAIPHGRETFEVEF